VVLRRVRSGEPTGTPSSALDETVRAATHGDEDAFTALWRSLNPSLTRYLRIRAGDAAEDLAADTWTAVIRGIGRFDGGERAFRSWLFTIARSKAVDESRRQWRRPVDLTGGYDGIERADPVDVAQAALDTVAAAEVIHLLRTLPADQAEIVALRVLADLDVQSVAAIVGKSTGAVRVAHHRALRRLAELVDAATMCVTA